MMAYSFFHSVAHTVTKMSHASEETQSYQDMMKLFDYVQKQKNPEFHVRLTPNSQDVLISLDEIMEYPYMVFNNRRGNFWIVIRLPGGVDPILHCKDNRIPQATLYATDAEQKAVWGMWKLKNPIPKENVVGSKYADDMRRTLRRRARTYSLEEDCDHHIGPNPFHEDWDVTLNGGDYTLDEIKRELLGERKMNEVIHHEYVKEIYKGVNEMMEAAFRDPDVPFEKLDIIGINEGRATMATHGMDTNIYMAHVRKAVQEQLKFLGGMDRDDYISAFSDKQRKRAKKKGERLRNHMKDRVLKTFEQTQSIRETAKKHKLPRSTVSDWLKRYQKGGNSSKTPVISDVIGG